MQYQANQAKLKIQDDWTKLAILEYIIRSTADITHVNNLLAAGVTPELLDTLRQRRPIELVELAGMSETKMELHLDCKSLLAGTRRLDMIKRQRFLQEYFVKYGAPTEMCIALFKMTSTECREMRRLLCPGMTSAGNGKPVESVRDTIHSAWAEIERSEFDLRERYYQLHVKFDAKYSMQALWKTVHEFDDEDYVDDKPDLPPTGSELRLHNPGAGAA
jgi:Protein of unknown function (DUF2857)